MVPNQDNKGNRSYVPSSENRGNAPYEEMAEDAIIDANPAEVIANLGSEGLERLLIELNRDKKIK